LWRRPQPAGLAAPRRALQDAWVRDIAANLTFPDDGAAGASTQQQ